MANGEVAYDEDKLEYLMAKVNECAAKLYRLRTKSKPPTLAAFPSPPSKSAPTAFASKFGAQYSQSTRTPAAMKTVEEEDEEDSPG